MRVLCFVKTEKTGLTDGTGGQALAPGGSLLGGSGGGSGGEAGGSAPLFRGSALFSSLRTLCFAVPVTPQTVNGFLFRLAREVLGSGLGVGLSWSVQDQLAFGFNSDLEFAPV